MAEEPHKNNNPYQRGQSSAANPYQRVPSSQKTQRLSQPTQQLPMQTQRLSQPTQQLPMKTRQLPQTTQQLPMETRQLPPLGAPPTRPPTRPGPRKRVPSPGSLLPLGDLSFTAPPSAFDRGKRYILPNLFVIVATVAILAAMIIMISSGRPESRSHLASTSNSGQESAEKGTYVKSGEESSAGAKPQSNLDKAQNDAETLGYLYNTYTDNPTIDRPGLKPQEEPLLVLGTENGKLINPCSPEALERLSARGFQHLPFPEGVTKPESQETTCHFRDPWGAELDTLEFGTTDHTRETIARNIIGSKDKSKVNPWDSFIYEDLLGLSCTVAFPFRGGMFKVTKYGLLTEQSSLELCSRALVGSMSVLGNLGVKKVDWNTPDGAAPPLPEGEEVDPAPPELPAIPAQSPGLDPMILDDEAIEKRFERLTENIGKPSGP